MINQRWLLLPAALFLFSCASVADREGGAIRVVKRVDLDRYIGRWYEIARLPNSFEKGLVCTTATYSIKKNGKIGVVNEGRKGSSEGRSSRATGTAWVVDPEEPGKLKVTFFWPFASDYWIIALDSEEYRYAMVAGSDKKYLWILSREPVMDGRLYDELVESARMMGFETDLLYKVPQVCD
ncbi:MAG: lipocalin family protein [Spirochaetes bacterium]|nr:lipocalin family protein [Spirochaetota bacterium]